MGYTHYWYFKKPKRGEAKKAEIAYQKAVKAINTMLVKHNQTATGENRLSGYSAHSLEYGGIKFNGKGDMSHEDFCLREYLKENEGFGFCKTARKPYDLFVVAALCILKYHLKDLIEVSSDGYAEEWNQGVFYAQFYTGKKAIKNPIPKREKREAA